MRLPVLKLRSRCRQSQVPDAVDLHTQLESMLDLRVKTGDDVAFGGSHFHGASGRAAGGHRNVKA
jgi:hypothetical protein